MREHFLNVRKLLYLVPLAAFVGMPAWATTTGGVFGPAVSPGEQELAYRAAYDHDSFAFAQRLHFQRSVNDTWRWRGIVQTRKTDDGDADFDFVQAEFFIDLSEDQDRWRQGLRIDLRVRDDDRPGQVGVNWVHQFKLSRNWRARLLALPAVQVGSNARSGVQLESRASLIYTGAERWSAGLEMFNIYGFTADMPDFDEQNHQLGPTLNASFGGGWQLLAGLLVGVSDGAPDSSFRLWLSKAL